MLPIMKHSKKTVNLAEKRDTSENEDKVRTETHDNDRKGIRKRKRARLG